MSVEPLDLDGDSRRALELDALLDLLAGYARTRDGKARLSTLAPGTDAAALREELASVGEARRSIVAEGSWFAAELSDPAPALEGLSVAGLALPASTLRALAHVVLAAATLRQRLRQPGPPPMPRLAAIAASMPDLRTEARAVLAGTDGEGRILDEASPALRDLRWARQRLTERLRALLLRLVRDPAAQEIIQDDFVTQRNGRFVVPVRTDAPRPLRGIVHASSSSGATRFVEPLESVESNNELIRLAELEQEEEYRVLLEWSEAFRQRRAATRALIEIVTRLDTLQARARFALDYDAIEPELVTEGDLELGAARHPLLQRRLGDSGQRPVPLDLQLSPAFQVLVISGPNTGGKTVALKTLGLCVLMAQCGIPVAASRARLPVYRQLRADIGDHQSIDADLSTFSAHVRAVAGCLRDVRPPALLLFDEIGTGTEPAEGAALALAVLETFLSREVTAVATTHLAALKAWSFTTSGASSAAMEFDAHSLQPTFRIQMHAAGTSAGLAMAERYGMPAFIVERARARLGPDAVEAELFFERLRQTLAAAEGERQQLAAAQSALEDERRRFHERHIAQAERAAEEARRSLQATLSELRQQAQEAVGAIVDEASRLAAERQLRRVERQLAERARLHHAGSGDAGSGVDRIDRANWVVPTSLEAGTTVWLSSLLREGEVQEADRDTAQVIVGSLSLRVALAALRVAPKTSGGVAATPRSIAARDSRPQPAATPRGTAHGAIDDLHGSGVPKELMLVGQRVDPALESIDRFLDAAVLAGHEEVRIVHGHGTGRLRQAVRELLREHPHVLAQRSGLREEGGDGVTLVTLR